MKQRIKDSISYFLEKGLWLWALLSRRYSLYSSNAPIICFTEEAETGHRNIRYQSLLPRLRMVHELTIFAPSSYFSKSRFPIVNRWRLYWHKVVLYPFYQKYLSNQYKLQLYTRENPDLIRLFKGDVIVDSDDPRFTQTEIEALNAANVLCVVTTSELMRAQFLRAGLAKPCHVIPSGVELKSLKTEARNRLQLPSKSNPVIGYAIPYIYLDEDIEVQQSPDAKLRSISFLLQVMNQVWNKMPDTELWLIGLPSPSVQALAKNTPKLHLLGYIEHDDLLHFVSLFDIAVYPRPVDYAGRHSIKLLEFMACSVPVVTTNVSEAYLIKDSKSGLVANNVQEFAEHLIYLLQNPAVRNDMGKRGRNHAEAYDWDLIAKRYEDEILIPYLEQVTVE